MLCLDVDIDNDSFSFKILIEFLFGGIVVYNIIRNVEV